MKNLIGLIILIGLATAAYFLLNTDSSSGDNEVLKEFSIEDTAAVDQIYLSQPNGKELLLSRRESDKWLVNGGKREARMDAVNLILTTLHDIKIKSPVSKETFSGVVKRLASGSTKVEFYTGDEDPEKTWYIGDASPGRTGTYMLLEENGQKSSKPFVTHLIMEKGYLGSRFFLDPVLWRDRDMMKTNPQEIKMISVNHFYDTATSFTIEKLADSKFEITNLSNNEKHSLPSEIAIPYFKNFSAVYYEYIDLKTASEQLDSIYNTFPRHKIEITMADGKKIKMDTYNMPVPQGSIVDGKPISFHPERMYAYSSELGTDVHPIVQNHTFDALVPRFEDFISSTTVEK